MRRLARDMVRVGLIHGDVPEEERRELRNRFSLNRENPDSLDLLLSSEVGCEGLDYQFCDGLVNYDLPWNPMRVEQRIGRIDRYGQRSQSVAIYNLITPGTVDAEIYERCLLRIGVFHRALGGSEEILGQLTRELHDIADNLDLTPQEQVARLQQLADNEIRSIQEQAKLEEEQEKFFGLHVPQRDKDMVKQASSFWLAPPMLCNLIEIYLRKLEDGKTPRALGLKPVTTLQLSQEIRARLLSDFRALDKAGTAARAWERWLKGSDPNLTITFDPVAADERRDIAFVTPGHPLARQAARAMEPGVPLICHLSVKASGAQSGRYPYAIYCWRKIGLKDDFTFQPVTIDPELGSRMLVLLRDTRPVNTLNEDLTPDEEQMLEEVHHRLWNAARTDHIAGVSRVTSSRQASLTASHAARMALLEEQCDSATDIRIQRMRESQIESAKRDYTSRSENLAQAPAQADIIAEAVALGVLIVEEW